MKWKSEEHKAHFEKFFNRLRELDRLHRPQSANVERTPSKQKIKFGCHIGKKFNDIPAEYLIWLYENQKVFGQLKTYIKNNLDTLKNEINGK